MPADALTTHRPPRLALTDLNRATSAAYSRCVANGGHVDSGERVTRLYPATVRSLRRPIRRPADDLERREQGAGVTLAMMRP